jgi:glycosyltransferase involved in cell wall biosynthesis
MSRKVREAILSEIQKQGCSNISYTEFQLKKDAYVKFLKSVDCLLSLTKGEGFSIQPREAMALGIPVIVSDNTAQSTICKTGLVKVVSSAIAEPAYPFHDPHSCGYQFNCDVDEAARAIEDVYNNYQHYLNKGPLMRQWASGYDYSKLTPLYESIVSPKRVILGKTNEFLADGTMITDSDQLYDKYVKVMGLTQPLIRADKKTRIDP